MEWIYTLVAALLIVVPLWRIFGRAGMPAALSLFVLIPIAGFAITLPAVDPE